MEFHQAEREAVPLFAFRGRFRIIRNSGSGTVPIFGGSKVTGGYFTASFYLSVS